MARSVADAAVLLAVLAGPDPRDPITLRGEPDLALKLDRDGLQGARIGIARNFFGFSPRVDAIMEECVRVLAALGAQIIDPVEVAHAKEISDTELEVLLYEFHADLDAYLASRGPTVLVRSLADVIAFNDAHADRVMPYFGQELMHMACAKGPLTDERYLQALATNHRLARTEGIDATLAQNSLDAIVEPSGGPAWLTDYIAGDHYTGGTSTPAAVAGYPSITVPAGYIYGLPVGLTFTGPAWSESKLIRYAYAFEQATRVRQPPQFLTSVRL